MVERPNTKAAGPGEAERPLMTTEQFEASPEFRKLSSAIRKILRVSKTELDERVRHAKATSPRIDNPTAPGRKRKRA